MASTFVIASRSTFSPAVLLLSTIVIISNTPATIARSDSGDEFYSSSLYRDAPDNYEDKTTRNLDGIEHWKRKENTSARASLITPEEKMFKELEKLIQLKYTERKNIQSNGGGLDVIGGGHLVRTIPEDSDKNSQTNDVEVILTSNPNKQISNFNNEYPDGIPLGEKWTIHRLIEKYTNKRGEDNLDSIGGGNLLDRRNLDSIGGGHLLKRQQFVDQSKPSDYMNEGDEPGKSLYYVFPQYAYDKRHLDSIGGGNLLSKRHLDGIGRGNLLDKRHLDSIGGGNLLDRRQVNEIDDPFILYRGNFLRKRYLDSIGGGNLLDKRNLDSIGGGNLLSKRHLDSIGGGNLLDKRHLDSIGGANLLDKRFVNFIGGRASVERRQLDSIGGGNLLDKRYSPPENTGHLLTKRNFIQDNNKDIKKN